jgi:hypothetical protein
MNQKMGDSPKNLLPWPSPIIFMIEAYKVLNSNEIIEEKAMKKGFHFVYLVRR